MIGHHEPSSAGSSFREARAGLPLLRVLRLRQGGQYRTTAYRCLFQVHARVIRLATEDPH